MSTPSPDSETVYSCARFTVHEVPVTLPSGEQVIKPIIRQNGAVVIVPELPDGRIVMIRNYRYSLGKTLLELPAGTMEPNEDPLETAVRELQEETGYVAGSIKAVQPFYAAPGNCNEQMHLFIARDLTQGPPKRELGEQIENEILDWETIAELLQANQIEDAKTLIGVMMYDRFYRQQKSPR
ncbi:ADP-ribose pyrophosphatase [Roseimaritima multifibrata]|uniref:GDP-mannose pyrophosphatase n=1 Tax=Roseimaritima multifibrata TaxID=1930274 RepID=A0A517MAT6_9BACT|nr:NUDIX hydrolase [Roseimaritima multifibrata]QDS91999.1 ADP-ribose pyrophosphatase [Roseimaritima multifibrata]